MRQMASFYKDLNEKNKVEDSLSLTLINSDKMARRLERHCSRIESLKEASKIRQKKKKSCTYQLKAIINHIGNASFGHYTTFIKIDGDWFGFNDSQVSKIEEENVLKFAKSGGKNSSNNCYCLFYQRSNN